MGHMFSEPQSLGLGIPPEEASGISTDIEQTMLELVVDGFKQWEREEFSRYSNKENHFTIRLAECMRKARGDLPPKNWSRYNVSNGP